MPEENIVKNTFIQVFGRIGTIIITLLTTIILTRLMGAQGYGSYIFIITLVMLFVTISDWGTALISVRESSKASNNEVAYFSNSLLLRLTLATVSVVIFLGIILFTPQLKMMMTPLRLSSLLIILISIKTSTHIVFQTKLKFGYIAITDILISTIFLLIVLFATGVVKLKPDLLLIAISLIVANAIGVLYLLMEMLKIVKYRYVFDKTIVKKIFMESIPTGALLLVFSIYNRLDIVILQIIKGSEAVGVYGLAYKVYDNLILGAAFFAGSLFPVISKIISDKKDLTGIQKFYKKAFDVLVVAGILISLGTFIFSKFIIDIVGGPDFVLSVGTLRILSVAIILAYFNHLTGYTLIALGKQRISLGVAVVALFWNLLLNLIFIPQYSFTASALITIATELLVFVFTSLYLANKFNLKPHINFIPTIIDLVKTKGKIY